MGPPPGSASTKLIASGVSLRTSLTVRKRTASLPLCPPFFEEDAGLSLNSPENAERTSRPSCESRLHIPPVRRPTPAECQVLLYTLPERCAPRAQRARRAHLSSASSFSRR